MLVQNAGILEYVRLFLPLRNKYGARSVGARDWQRAHRLPHTLDLSACLLLSALRQLRGYGYMNTRGDGR